jgi:hypothetical protein
MSEKVFWKCTPRKIAALADVHMKINGSGVPSPQESQVQTINDLMSW